MEPAQPTQAEIKELREQLLKKVEEDGASIPGGIHPADLARIQDGDDWLRRFLLHNDRDIKESLTMAWDTCKWRKTFGTNDLNEQTVRKDYLQDGSMFSYSRDNDGKSLFILKCKKHVKGQRDLEELKKCLVYWFERLERQDKGDMITLFFDMSETGLSNMDMDYTKYLISLFKMYYPFYLNYILIFEMPWILNTAFKIIKTWLPEKAVKKINFVNKSTLKNFVEPERALASWGGQDNYEFVFVPEDRNGKGEKKVHFADNQADSSPTSETAQALPGLKIKISPTDLIVFNAEGSELTGSLSLTNADDKIISYKLKTTSPETYRVKPCLGVLKPGASVSVSVMVHAGFQLSSISKDKFLVMGMPLESGDISNQELSDLWKKGHSATEINRLRCSTTGGSPADTSSRNGGILASSSASSVDKLSLMCDNVAKLVQANKRLETELGYARILQNCLVLGVAMCLIGISYLIYVIQGVSEIEQESCPITHYANA
ncbi:motile sperm domain-containing protein 2-like isoform X2 [Thrips palmi]|uniref:Motile sperm domain-containing protein 2-like isoform X2 n=1 Tax=Thrips palmi TaxID=161013 RepID=A0A6P8XZ46_THRPL|nr:motile sperm domain-containing protein 2-like isoform X2 [Thrips palmi]